ncbi:MAG: ankyrin repeat domain-containing protein [Candidatus Babeliales bacterium]
MKKLSLSLLLACIGFCNAMEPVPSKEKSRTVAPARQRRCCCISVESAVEPGSHEEKTLTLSDKPFEFSIGEDQVNELMEPLSQQKMARVYAVNANKITRSRSLTSERMQQLVTKVLREEATKDMFHAVVNNHPGLVAASIGDGAYVNATINNKWTALHFAARDRNVEVAKILLAVRGINTALVNGSGDTAEQVVLQRRSGATPEHQALCDKILELLGLHKRGKYPYSLKNGNLIPKETVAQAVEQPRTVSFAPTMEPVVFQ